MHRSEDRADGIRDEEREKVVALFLGSRDNTARAIAERLGMRHGRVDRIIS